MRSLLIIIAALVLSACGNDKSVSLERTEAVVTGVSFVGVSVSDLDKSASLYSAAAGLSIVHQQTIENSRSLDKMMSAPNVRAEAQLLRSANAQLLFMQFDNPSETAKNHSPIEVNGPGIAHVCFQVNAKTETYQRFLSGGATHIGAKEMVQINPRNPVYYAYAKDTDGTVFEVEHVDIEALDLPEPPKNDHRIRHVSLATSDMDRILDFYSILLEQSSPRRAGRFLSLSGENLDKVSGFPESKIQMAWFQIRNLELEIIEYHSPAPKVSELSRPVDAHGYNMIVLDVSDLATAREKFVEAGGKIISEGGEIFGDAVIFGRDPDGNLIGLQKSRSENVFSAKNFIGNGT